MLPNMNVFRLDSIFLRRLLDLKNLNRENVQTLTKPKWNWTCDLSALTPQCWTLHHLGTLNRKLSWKISVGRFAHVSHPDNVLVVVLRRMFSTFLLICFLFTDTAAQGRVCARRECTDRSVTTATQVSFTSAAPAVDRVSVTITPPTATHSLVSCRRLCFLLLRCHWFSTLLFVPAQ